MKTLAAILFLAFSAWSACTKITYPTDYSTVSSGTRANLKANFDAIKTVDDPCKDSVDEVRARFTGYTGSLRMSSLDHLMLRLDTDGSLLGRLGILNGFTGDTLFRVTEDSTWKAWGAGVGTKLTLSDSILAATARISGNGTFGGTLGVMGASTLAALSATTGSFSSTLAASGQSTLAGITLNGGSSGQGRIYTTGTVGLALQALAGSSYDFSILGTSGIGSYVMRVPTGTTTAVFPNGMEMSFLSSGRVPVTGSGGVIAQDNIYWDATNDRLGIGDGAALPAGKLDLRTSQVGGTVQGIAFNSDNTNGASHARWQATSGGASGGDAYFQASISGVIDWAQGIDNSDADAWVLSEASTLGTNNRVRVSSTQFRTYGNLQVDGTATFSSTITTPLTASLPVFTNGSSQLTTNAMTGTGSVMMSSSPTTTGTLTGAAANFSGAVTASQITLGGGEAFVYGDTTFTLTATGMTTSPTGTAYATRIGKVVTLTLPYITGTSNSGSFTLNGMSSSWLPSTLPQTIPIALVTDNGTLETGAFVYVQSSNFVIARAGNVNWTASGTKSLGNSVTQYQNTITYYLQ